MRQGRGKCVDTWQVDIGDVLRLKSRVTQVEPRGAGAWSANRMGVEVSAVLALPELNTAEVRGKERVRWRGRWKIRCCGNDMGLRWFTIIYFAINCCVVMRSGKVCVLRFGDLRTGGLQVTTIFHFTFLNDQSQNGSENS